jgi:hypothetical protein
MDASKKVSSLMPGQPFSLSLVFEKGRMVERRDRKDEERSGGAVC